MPPFEHTLNGTAWQFASVPQRSTSFQEDDRAHGEGWRTAAVPGHVHADLLDHGLIPDIDADAGLRQCAWVNGRDWWYERDVELRVDPGQRIFLRFRGIDYLADIWWNERRLKRHEGQFVEEHLELTHDVPHDGRVHTHKLGVRLWGADAWPEPALGRFDRLWAPFARLLHKGKGSVVPYHRRLGLLRNQLSFGWDFAPQLCAPGIWDDVSLYVTGDIHIVDAWVRSDPQRPQLHIELDATAPHDGRIRVDWHVLGEPAAGDGLEAKVAVRPGRHRVTIPLSIEGPRLWHPWEHGSSWRYQAIVRVAGEGGVSDEVTLTFGLRHLVWDGWRLFINGRRLFLRGVNWVPADLLPGRLGRADYTPLLQRAVDAGVNFIRVWGGGLREKCAFYDLCDELGLLVWQELPFACTSLDRYPTTPAFLDRAERTAIDIVRTVRGHPSLIRWGAGNEYGPNRHRALIQRLRRAVRVHDGTRPMSPPSPGPDDAHNWDVWHGYAPIHAYLDGRASMVSEFGLQALPAYKTLAEIEDERELWPPGEVWERRLGELSKLDRYVHAIVRERPSSLKAYITASQSVQARGLQTMIEHQRRRRGGVIVWQFNEPWPAISWALIDHCSRPKAAYDLLKRAYARLLVSLAYEPRSYRTGDRFHAELWAINDLPEAVRDAEARVYHGKRCIVDLPFSLPAGCARPIYDLKMTLREPLTLRVEMWRAQECITWLGYDLAWYDSETMPLYAWLRRRLAELLMRL